MHSVKVCLHDAISACQFILTFTKEIALENYQQNHMVKSAVERQFEILGEALNRIKKLDTDFLNDISDWQRIIAFRNVIAHGYDAIDDEVVFLIVKNKIPKLLKELNNKF